MWKLAIYSLLSAEHAKLSREKPLNILVESLKFKLNGLNKEVVFSRRWSDIIIIIIKHA